MDVIKKYPYIMFLQHQQTSPVLDITLSRSWKRYCPYWYMLGRQSDITNVKGRVTVAHGARYSMVGDAMLLKNLTPMTDRCRRMAAPMGHMDTSTFVDIL